jgi:hypothetical protein
MDSMAGQLKCRTGDEVHSSDDHKMGKVIAADAKFLTVEHGFLMKKQYFVPQSAVNTCSSGQVHLNLTKAQITKAKWDVPPAMGTEAGNPPLSP